ncbi:hypothetical protein ACFO1B_15305 [Dactylosporangium siamense]|uniref:Glycosyl transferase family 28 C-terminal domain-containing protein n=1 Tax=Dactylosporangium siamense TaxID=685454 RepID=A0A919PN45_9ACTN|nr:hypothetical protein [Dactylosporangium siamense]GIG45203.1 hypothetical protein Dsi01nite_032440 [Dactylosporangium siamense]
MTDTVVFCFKGRHGLGHTRRALLSAEALAAADPSLRVVLVSQCRSIDLLRRTRLPVINLPVLERLPNDAVDAAFLRLLDALGTRLAPALVVEDTYPDPRHLFLAPFRDAAKALLMSGMTSGTYLERIRQDGLLRHYDRILIARDEASVAGIGDLTPPMRTVLGHSARIRYTGPVYAAPSTDEVAAAAARFGGGPLVVVNAGAGGDVTTQAFPERLFRSMTEVAARLLDERTDAHVVLVAGPYYAGSRPAALPNVSFVPFAPDLPALLHAARVAVIRPGSNVLRETLSGPASTVIVPNFSWAENQQDTADRLVASVPYVAQATCDDVDALHRLTREGLRHPPRPPWEEARSPAADLVAAQLLEVLRDPVPPVADLFLLAGGLGTAERREVLARHLPGAADADADTRLLLLDRVPAVHLTPALLHERGVRLVAVPDGASHDPRHGVNYDDGYGFDLPVWQRAHRLADHGLASVRVHHHRAVADRPEAVRYRLDRLRHDTALPAVWLDLRAVPTGALPAYAAGVGTALSGLTFATVTDLLDRQVSAQLL